VAVSLVLFHKNGCDREALDPAKVGAIFPIAVKGTSQNQLREEVIRRLQAKPSSVKEEFAFRQFQPVVRDYKR
jgi:hypothetical protein